MPVRWDWRLRLGYFGGLLEGSLLVYLLLASSSQEVWTIQADGSNPRQVTHDGQIKLGYLIWR